jgi:hypothetical protein
MFAPVFNYENPNEVCALDYCAASTKTLTLASGECAGIGGAAGSLTVNRGNFSSFHNLLQTTQVFLDQLQRLSTQKLG